MNDNTMVNVVKWVTVSKADFTLDTVNTLSVVMCSVRSTVNQSSFYTEFMVDALAKLFFLLIYIYAISCTISD